MQGLSQGAELQQEGQPLLALGREGDRRGELVVTQEFLIKDTGRTRLGFLQGAVLLVMAFLVGKRKPPVGVGGRRGPRAFTRGGTRARRKVQSFHQTREKLVAVPFQRGQHRGGVHVSSALYARKEKRETSEEGLHSKIWERRHRDECFCPGRFPPGRKTCGCPGKRGRGELLGRNAPHLLHSKETF